MTGIVCEKSSRAEIELSFFSYFANLFRQIWQACEKQKQKVNNVNCDQTGRNRRNLFTKHANSAITNAD